MRRARLVPASIVHVGWLANNLRAVDRLECEALGRKPKDALRLSIRTSLYALTALDSDNRPLCMLGVCPGGMLMGVGVPWLLGTDDLLNHKLDLVQTGRRVIAWWSATFPVMENIVAKQNVKAIALLKHWGAEIGSHVETHGGVEFLTFRFEAAIQGEQEAA
jgi:hypothetical protein